MPLANAYETWREAEEAQIRAPSKENSEAADEAFEALSALAFQQGYETAGQLSVVAWVVREIGG